jgi:chromosome segregation ATPase
MSSADSVDSRREEHEMDQDVDLLAQRVEKQRAKLEEEVTLLDMTEKRVAAADSDRQSAARETERLKSRAKKAKRDARRLSSEAKRAQVRLEASDSDHAQAVKEAKSRGKTVAKRQQKLAEAEGAHAAAKAETTSAAQPPSTRRRSSSPTSAAKKTATPAKRAASSATRKRTTKATGRPSTTKKTG